MSFDVMFVSYRPGSSRLGGRFRMFVVVRCCGGNPYRALRPYGLQIRETGETLAGAVTESDSEGGGRAA